MTVKHPNFFENMKEASMRLQDTVVLYDGQPYYVYLMADHKQDGIFRVYLDSLLQKDGLTHNRVPLPYTSHEINQRAKDLDDFLDKNPDCGIIRKMANSPLFDRFRPFPLGMCNYKGLLYYLERSPTRHTQQGMTQQMLTTTQVSLASSIITPNDSPARRQRNNVPLVCYETGLMIAGAYPDADTVLKKLLSPGILNEGVGFCREFALVRGPLNLIFLAYKTDVIGWLPASDFSLIRLEKGKRHLYEKVQALGLFSKIDI